VSIRKKIEKIKQCCGKTIQKLSTQSRKEQSSVYWKDNRKNWALNISFKICWLYIYLCFEFKCKLVTKFNFSITTFCQIFCLLLKLFFQQIQKVYNYETFTSSLWTTIPFKDLTLLNIFCMSSRSIPLLQSSRKIVRNPSSRECRTVWPIKSSYFLIIQLWLFELKIPTNTDICC